MRRKHTKTEQARTIACVAAAAVLLVLVLCVSQLPGVKYAKADSSVDMVETAQLPDMSSVILQQGKDESSVKVNWLTKEQNEYKVEYYKPDEPGSVNKYTDVAMSGEAGQKKDVYCYTAPLEGLDSNTRYGYRIVTADGLTKGKEYYFQTPANQGLFSFLFTGDAQIGAKDKKHDAIGWERTLNTGRTATPKAAFILSAGDQTDNAKYETALEQYFSFRSPELLKEVPIATVRGNHEESDGLYDMQFKGPGQTVSGDYYFKYDQTLFICIDSNDDEYDAHRKFIKETIESTSHQWVIIMMHHPVFGGATPNDRIKKLRGEYIEFFSDMDIDLVLSGHEHLYARSFIMDGTESTGKDGGVKTMGQTMYLDAGSSSGSKFDHEHSALPDYIAYSNPKYVAYMTGIEISGKEMVISTYSSLGMEKIDSCVLKK